MIRLDKEEEERAASASSPTMDHPLAPPPPFQDDPSPDSAHTVLDFADVPPPTAEERGPPPDFSIYQAEHFEDGLRNVISHDPHLNSDGEALYRFLLSQASIPPTYRLHIRGTHSETRYRWVTDRHSDGRTHSRQESYNETVTDFDFFIDSQPGPSVAPIQWTSWDHMPMYRGSMVREIETYQDEHNTHRRKAKRGEVRRFNKWDEERVAQGLPPWVHQLNGWPEESPPFERDVMRSSKTVRQWADEYCASPKYLKEFVYKKVIYGWNIRQLEDAIRSVVEATPYSGTWKSTLHWLIISIIFLIYPFIWLFKRFHSHGGGIWSICGAAYPMKRYVPLEEGEPSAGSSKAVSSPTYNPSSSRIVRTQQGMKKVEGVREGEWLRKWEGTIKHAVSGRYQNSAPLLESTVFSEPASALALDGYSE
ncbi:hypothetical protein BDQ17DRAFT_1418251 [Cyathus striatus]|nr:hypothetical protein BDQ17DRAFT_1418251 [Cyathus striatus]